MIKFYDTSALLMKCPNVLFEEEFEISKTTLGELEGIRKDYKKPNKIRYAARELLRAMEANIDKVKIIDYCYTPSTLSCNNDDKILYDAMTAHRSNLNELIFYTNDYGLKIKAIKALGADHVSSVAAIQDPVYTGYVEAHLTDEMMEEFYSNFNYNHFDLFINQYLIIYDIDGNYLDAYCWTGETHRRVEYKGFSSKWLGDIKPMKDDQYQFLAGDSLANNQITMLKGPAGAGKSYLALGYLFSLLDRGKIDRIIIFCNTVATKDSARLGFYPGDRTTKLMDSQIGNFLISKLGGSLAVEQLIGEEKLMLIPLSDARGFDTSGMRAGIYVTEAQNLNINLMKLMLQRIGEDSICIIDGDDEAQVDLPEYDGDNNGMKRLSKVFRGHDLYGEVKLQKIHRSKIAELAEEM